MIVINTISDTKFSFNGVNYLKNFTPIVVGNKIRILNTYDSKIELTDAPTLFSEFTVNGSTFASISLLQDALLLVIFTRSSLVPNEGTLTPLITNATVSGTYDLAYGNNYDLTLTGNTTFTESNFPASGLTDIIAIRVTGNFALTYPANWTTSIIGIYDGTKQNDVFVYRIASGKYSVVINTY